MAGSGSAGKVPSSRSSGTGAAGAATRIRGRVARRRRLRFLFLALLILLLGLVIAWFVWLRDLPMFEIREVQVTGLETLSGGEGEAEATELTETVTASLGGMTTVHIRQGDLDEALAPFPRVAGVEVETDFPNGATARLDLREDGAVLGEEEEAVLVATDGTVLGPAPDGVETLPLIPGEAPPSDRTSLGGPRLSQAIVLGSVPTEIRPFVVKSRMGDKGIEVELSNGLVLVFGDDSKAGAKWKAATTVIADPELVSARYIDLTVPWRPAVGP